MTSCAPSIALSHLSINPFVHITFCANPEVYAHVNGVNVCVFIAVVLMLPLTQNPSLSPAMRLQPAMGNADYCCYSIRQSACVCMCVLVSETVREKRENGYYPRC